MKYIVALSIAILLSVFAGAPLADTEQEQGSSAVTAMKDAASCEQLKQSGASADVLAQRGCCSWHQGVCGCSGGRTVCCDGTYSPSCTCNREDPPIVTN